MAESSLSSILPRLVCPALVGIMALFSLPAGAAPLKVVIPPLEETASASSVYFPRLLDLALSKTEATHGSYVIEHYPKLWTAGRFLAELKRGRTVNVIWSMAHGTGDEDLQRIPISLLRGLNSHRVLLIRTEDRARFENVDSAEDLGQLRAGQGQHWGDTQVLRANSMPVVTSAHYELLFSMLAGGRFDYFPRGLYEVWDEYEQHRGRGLAIEQTLMLRYPAPIYFYVNREDAALAERVEQGLRMAQADGSLDALFFSIPGFRLGHAEMLNPRRKILELALPQPKAPRQ